MRLYSDYKSAVGINDEFILGRVHSQAYLLDEVEGLELRQFMSGIHEKQSTFSAGDHSFFCGFGELKSTGLCPECVCVCSGYMLVIDVFQHLVCDGNLLLQHI